MKEIDFKPQAVKDLLLLPKTQQAKLIKSLELFAQGNTADVKKLKNFTPAYRLRAGDYRLLFEADETRIVVYRIIHRKDACKKK